VHEQTDARSWSANMYSRDSKECGRILCAGCRYGYRFVIYRGGLRGGLRGGFSDWCTAGTGGRSPRSGASSRVTVGLRKTFRRRLIAGTPVGWGGAPMLFRLCDDSIRVNMAAEVKSLLHSKLGLTRSIDILARSNDGRGLSIDMRGVCFIGC